LEFKLQLFVQSTTITIFSKLQLALAQLWPLSFSWSLERWFEVEERFIKVAKRQLEVPGTAFRPVPVEFNHCPSPIHPRWTFPAINSPCRAAISTEHNDIDEVALRQAVASLVGDYLL